MLKMVEIEIFCILLSLLVNLMCPCWNKFWIVFKKILLILNFERLCLCCIMCVCVCFTVKEQRMVRLLCLTKVLPMVNHLDFFLYIKLWLVVNLYGCLNNWFSNFYIWSLKSWICLYMCVKNWLQKMLALYICSKVSPFLFVFKYFRESGIPRASCVLHPRI